MSWILYIVFAVAAYKVVSAYLRISTLRFLVRCDPEDGIPILERVFAEALQSVVWDDVMKSDAVVQTLLEDPQTLFDIWSSSMRGVIPEEVASRYFEWDDLALAALVRKNLWVVDAPDGETGGYDIPDEWRRIQEGSPRWVLRWMLERKEKA